MLKGIPSILSPELLKVLDEMGHSDEIVIADGNFPGASHAQRLKSWTLFCSCFRLTVMFRLRSR